MSVSPTTPRSSSQTPQGLPDMPKHWKVPEDDGTLLSSIRILAFRVLCLVSIARPSLGVHCWLSKNDEKEWGKHRKMVCVFAWDLTVIAVYESCDREWTLKALTSARVASVLHVPAPMITGLTSGVWFIRLIVYLEVACWIWIPIGVVAMKVENHEDREAKAKLSRVKVEAPPKFEGMRMQFERKALQLGRKEGSKEKSHIGDEKPETGKKARFLIVQPQYIVASESLFHLHEVTTMQIRSGHMSQHADRIASSREEAHGDDSILHLRMESLSLDAITII
ncbi:uncharacterized protein F5891DRAFT_982210 [Suillus fuscotomentosus]|uniref:Uncharacterized protein n=1 Tax=Suillus fuscotomentosus TaxID=1912939 RepID=A0AAD4E1R7_9AGAM|nr:uncharacterized protein F5891DRAFT_982210 [Suillus fuscotomentosus]KAG1898027.1 hypothetical protein F5891DRAFT_982210 [Suillus fuscotomentosus]